MTFPFSTRRRVLWGDSDPAGVIFTPRVFYYAIETVEEWMLSVLGHDSMALQEDFKLDTPTVKMGCEFMHPVRTGDWVDLTLKVENLGGASINYVIDGFNAEKRHCFQVDQVSCFVDADTFKPVRVSSEFREKIEAYQAACDPSNLKSRGFKR